MKKEDIVSFLREHKSFFKEHFCVEKIGLFGSYARGEADEKSDIDIIVEMPSDFDRYYDLKDFLEEAFDKRVDLGLQGSLRNLIKTQIEDEIIYV